MLPGILVLPVLVLAHRHSVVNPDVPRQPVKCGQDPVMLDPPTRLDLNLFADWLTKILLRSIDGAIENMKPERCRIVRKTGFIGLCFIGSVGFEHAGG